MADPILYTVLYYSLLLVLAGKLAAEVVSEKAAATVGKQTRSFDSFAKAIEPSVLEAALSAVPKVPEGVKGEGAIAFGGGAQSPSAVGGGKESKSSSTNSLLQDLLTAVGGAGWLENTPFKTAAR